MAELSISLSVLQITNEKHNKFDKRTGMSFFFSFLCSFLGRIESIINCFRDFLTISNYFKAIGNGFKTVWKGVDHTPYSPSSDGPALSAQLNNEKPTTEGRTVRTPNGKQQIGRIGGHGFYIDSTCQIDFFA